MHLKRSRNAVPRLPRNDRYRVRPPQATGRGLQRRAPSHRRAQRGRVPGKERAATLSSRSAASCPKQRRPTRSRRAFRLSNADRSNKPLPPRCSTFSPISLAFQSHAQAASEARFICAGSVRIISARRSTSTAIAFAVATRFSSTGFLPRRSSGSRSSAGRHPCSTAARP